MAHSLTLLGLLLNRSALLYLYLYRVKLSYFRTSARNLCPTTLPLARGPNPLCNRSGHYSTSLIRYADASKNVTTLKRRPPLLGLLLVPPPGRRRCGTKMGIPGQRSRTLHPPGLRRQFYASPVPTSPGRVRRQSGARPQVLGARLGANSGH